MKTSYIQHLCRNRYDKSLFLTNKQCHVDKIMSCESFTLENKSNFGEKTIEGVQSLAL